MNLYKVCFYISISLLLPISCINGGQRRDTQFGVCYENPYYYQDLPEEWYEWEKYNWYHSCNRLRNNINQPGVTDNGNGQPGNVTINNGSDIELYSIIERNRRYHYSNPIIRKLQ